MADQYDLPPEAIPGVSGQYDLPPEAISDDDQARLDRLRQPEPDAKGTPAWSQWRNQRIADLSHQAGLDQQPPEDQGFFHGLWQQVNPFPAIGQLLTGQNPNTAANTDPNSGKWLVGKPVGPMQGIENMGVNAIRAQIAQGHMAAQAWRNGERTEALGHAMAAALPLLGPAAANAGETIGSGQTAQGLGQAAGIVGSILAPGAIAKTAAGLDALAPGVRPAYADWLKTSAETEYGRTLAATTKGNKLRSADVVPGLIDRGVTAMSLKGLAARAQSEIAATGQALGDEWNNLPSGTSTELQPIWNRMQNEIDTVHSIRNAQGQLIPKSSVAQQAIGNITKLQQTLMDVAEQDPATGKLMIPVDKVRDLRQYYDNVAADAGRYNGKDLADKSEAAAHGLAADAIRNELAKQFPSIDALNKEYSFWKNVNQVVTDTITRRQGQATSLSAKIAKGAGQAAGMVHGGAAGAIIGGQVMSGLEKAMQSPAWRTISAVYKDRLADAIASGNPGAIGFYTKKIIQAGAAQPVLSATDQYGDTVSQPAAGVTLAPGSTPYSLAPAK